MAWKLDKRREASADGFVVDVRWGLIERQPKVYNFDAYKQLVQMAGQRGLEVQLVASFHQCGGNVGDDCSIPSPASVTHHGDVGFKDQHGNQNKACISTLADDVPQDGGRTPLDMYGDWMAALARAFQHDHEDPGGHVALWRLSVPVLPLQQRLAVLRHR
ncbi:unnamed protein product [Prorocentrum cordatum]|uniref:Beta-amylase n=1 Tax=Prorocentrum cordatum TaxID=2364126 RepID=A0ABN9WCY4_9DINO|nr:unnamed protein product [Polarella glacialis]